MIVFNLKLIPLFIAITALFGLYYLIGLLLPSLLNQASLIRRSIQDLRANTAKYPEKYLSHRSHRRHK